MRRALRQQLARPLAAAAILAIAYVPRATHAADYSTGGTFLHLGHGARAFALGGGGVAALRSDEAAYWNPANLAWMRSQNSATLMDADVLPTIDDGYNSLSIARGFGSRLGLESQELRPTRGAYGLFFSHLGFQFDSGSQWSENVLQLAVAFAPNNYTAIGVGVKLLQANNDFADANGRGAGVDLSIATHITEHLRGAVVARDLWTRLEWDTDTHEVAPRTFTLGLEYSRWNIALLADWIWRQAAVERFILGAEWSLFDDIMAVRAAMTALQPGEPRAWPSAGAGFHVFGFTLDYGVSFDDADGMDKRQRVSLRFEF